MKKPRPRNSGPGGSAGDSPGESQGRAPSAAEDELWRQVTSDVKPLKSQDISPGGFQDGSPGGSGAGPSAAAHGAMPAAKPGKARPRKRAPPPPPPPPPPPAEPELRHGEAPGLDRRTRSRLRRGQVDIDATIDLHGLTRTEAHRALNAFLQGAQDAGRRSVLVITGKGSRGEGVLRDQVPNWLNAEPNRRMIRAFSHAAPKDGGQGALYVLLKRRK